MDLFIILSIKSFNINLLNELILIDDKSEIKNDQKHIKNKSDKIGSKNDIIILAGKGHENYQIIGKEKIHLDDSEEILNWK